MSDVFIHPSAFVDDLSILGNGTKVWHFTHIMNGSAIGSNCVIGQNVFISSNVKIGDNVKIQNNVSVYTGVICEDDVFLGPSCVFTNVINPRSFIERKNEFRPTLIKQGASIGANATIVCGNEIGRYALVGAGSVVTKNVIDFSMVYGVPAVHHYFICKCSQKLVFINGLAKCIACSKEYKIENDLVKEFGV